MANTDNKRVRMNSFNSIPVAMKRLGLKSRDPVYGLIRSGKLRSAKIGSRRVVSDNAIDDCIDELERDALTERDGHAA